MTVNLKGGSDIHRGSDIHLSAKKSEQEIL
jgi:hypothetical protein